MSEVVGFLSWLTQRYKDGEVSLRLVQIIGVEVNRYLRHLGETAK